MKCAWRFVAVLALATTCGRVGGGGSGGRRRRTGAPRESNGVVRLQHGSFQCMGALLTSRIAFTCCTCVSDVFFSCGEDSDQVTYEVRALTAENITVKSEDERRVPAKDVFIHPQCDIDGTYDYAIVTLTKAIGGKPVTSECLAALFGGHRQAPRSRQRRRHRPSGICVAYTILDDSADGEILQIYSQFVDWRNCWNGSETKPVFEAKYCLRTLDARISLENSKCGSPIFCERKLVGIIARRYAINGPIFASVNGLDGAIEFIRETVKLDIREDSEDDEEDEVRKKVGKKTDRKRKSDRRERET